MIIRSYEPERDEAPIYALWNRSLGAEWPLSQAAFHEKTVANEAYQPGDHIVAQEEGGGVVGFVATQARTLPGVPADRQPRGELMVLLVDSTYRRQGIGRRLLDQALAILKARGVSQAQLGAGGMAYFWAGVPTNLPGAWEFFAACGWPYVEQSYDLVRDLDDYITPPEIYARLRLLDIAFSTATADDVPAVLTFEAQHFPQWHRYYEWVVEKGTGEDIVVAKNGQGEVVGTSSVMDFRAEWLCRDFVWQALLGENVGGVGPLGVRDDYRGNGIGLALAAQVTERLKARGLARSYVGYTWLTDWYGRLGYRIWRDYRMSWKPM